MPDIAYIVQGISNAFTSEPDLFNPCQRELTYVLDWIEDHQDEFDSDDDIIDSFIESHRGDR